MSIPVSQDLHITIGSTPSSFSGAMGGVDLTSDVEMVKDAMLYADKATLCSPACSALLDETSLTDLSTSERIGFIEAMPLWFPNETQIVNQTREVLNKYREAWQQRRTLGGYLFLKKFEREINKRWDQIVDPFRKLFNESGGYE